MKTKKWFFGALLFWGLLQGPPTRAGSVDGITRDFCFKTARAFAEAQGLPFYSQVKFAIPNLRSAPSLCRVYTAGQADGCGRHQTYYVHKKTGVVMMGEHCWVCGTNPQYAYSCGEKKMFYHVIPLKDLRAHKVDQTYQPPSLKEEGFIHMTPEQRVVDVANKYFANAQDLLLLEISSESLSDRDLTWNYEYPHYHRPLEIKAISKIYKFAKPTRDGFVFPTEVISKDEIF